MFEQRIKSVYNTDESKYMKSISVILTWTLSGGGTSAHLFVTVTGLYNRGLPIADMLVVQVTGLCGIGANE